MVYTDEDGTQTHMDWFSYPDSEPTTLEAVGDLWRYDERQAYIVSQMCSSSDLQDYGVKA